MVCRLAGAKAVIRTNSGILLIEPLKTNFNDVLIEIHTFPFIRNWRLFCLGSNVLTIMWRCGKNVSVAQVHAYYYFVYAFVWSDCWTTQNNLGVPYTRFCCFTRLQNHEWFVTAMSHPPVTQVWLLWILLSEMEDTCATFVIQACLPDIIMAWWRHQKETFSALLAIWAGNWPVPGELPTHGQSRGALMFSLICVWINCWINNGDAGDLRRYRAHYDVSVMGINTFKISFVWLTQLSR